MALAAMAARDSVPLVIAAGGDGTLHEVAAGLVEGSADAASAPVLGILPLGTGNDFIKTLGVPSEWRAAVERLARGQPRRIDLGRLNGHVFVNNVGIGFDAQVGIEAQKVKWLKGEAVYLAGLLRALLGAYRTPEVTVQVDDQTLKQTVTMLDIGNGRCSGGSFWLNPEAQLDDGMLDVCVVAGLSRPGIMRLVPKVMKGAHAGEAAIRMLRGRRIQITSASPLPVHADGDVLYTDARALLLECLPGRVRMLV
jgi:YegS/Rv2252/BmrU family lipid kinase